MFILSLHYKVSIEKIQEFLELHNVFLEKNYKNKNFIMSGRKIPRTGGIIISTINDREQLLKVIAEDPFNINKLADYELIEFYPTMACNELSFLIDK